MNTAVANSTGDQFRTEDELLWTMTRVVREGRDQSSEEFSFDLTMLAKGYSRPFLIAVKTALINSRNRLSIKTIFNEYSRIRTILLKCQDAGITTANVEQIDLAYAPLACYDCNKFRPCWDADHTINLDLVNREIADFEGQGLALQHEVQKYKQLRNAIRVVISICQLKNPAAGLGESS